MLELLALFCVSSQPLPMILERIPICGKPLLPVPYGAELTGRSSAEFAGPNDGF